MGTVEGTYHTGGLVGENGRYGTIRQSYSMDTVRGETVYNGGLVGGNEGEIANCYSTGAVTGLFSHYSIGGLVGRNEGTVFNSFWDTDAQPQRPGQ